MTDMLKNCQLCPRACGAADFGYKWLGHGVFSHCSLGCVFCQNRKISRREAEGQNITADALAKTFLSLEKKGAHNINLVTGAHYVPQIIEALQRI